MEIQYTSGSLPLLLIHGSLLAYPSNPVMCQTKSPFIFFVRMQNEWLRDGKLSATDLQVTVDRGEEITSPEIQRTEQTTTPISPKILQLNEERSNAHSLGQGSDRHPPLVHNRNDGQSAATNVRPTAADLFAQIEKMWTGSLHEGVS